MQVEELVLLLKETALAHGAYEAVAPPHDWWDWYAAYLADRLNGHAPHEAASTANRYLAEYKHVLIPGD